MGILLKPSFPPVSGGGSFSYHNSDVYEKLMGVISA
jgi:hypothetical protein